MSVNHHIVTQAYLRAWELLDGPRRHVLVREIGRQTVRPRATRGICSEPNWNSHWLPGAEPNAEFESRIGMVESAGVPALKRYLEQGYLNDLDRANVAGLLASFAHRSRAFRRWISESGTAIGDEYRSHVSERVRRAVLHEQARFRDTGGSGQLEMSAFAHAKLVSIVASMRWQVLRDPRSAFVTGDAPVVFWAREARRSSSLITELPTTDAVFVPLTPSNALVATWGVGGDPDPAVAPVWFPGWLNDAIERQTGRHLVLPPESTARFAPDAAPWHTRNEARRVQLAFRSAEKTAQYDHPSKIEFVGYADGHYSPRTSVRPPPKSTRRPRHPEPRRSPGAR